MLPIFAANWKLHKTPQEAKLFFEQFVSEQNKSPVKGQVVFFPPAALWDCTHQALKNSGLQWGAQNIWTQLQGAFTGENSVGTLKAMGGTHALVGHSERRHLFGEKDEWTTEKVALLQGQGLTPLLCIGETLPERESGRTNEVNERQLRAGLAKAVAGAPLIVAYEPVWAIGTGKVATVSQVAEAHAFVRNLLRELGFAQAPLLYGGSVKPDNAGDLLKVQDVNGFLVGGASLEVGSFRAIAEA